MVGVDEPLPGCSLAMKAFGGPGDARAREFTRYGRAWASDPYVEPIWRAILAETSEPRVQRRAALQVVQLLPYRPDPPGTDDVLRSPCEILARGGDCNNKSAFLVGVLTGLGATAECRWIVQPLEVQDHVAVQVLVGRVWRWMEPTLWGALEGEYPHDAVRRLRGGRAL